MMLPQVCWPTGVSFCLLKSLAPVYFLICLALESSPVLLWCVLVIPSTWNAVGSQSKRQPLISGEEQGKWGWSEM